MRYMCRGVFSPFRAVVSEIELRFRPETPQKNTRMPIWPCRRKRSQSQTDILPRLQRCCRSRFADSLPPQTRNYPMDTRSVGLGASCLRTDDSSTPPNCLAKPVPGDTICERLVQLKAFISLVALRCTRKRTDEGGGAGRPSRGGGGDGSAPSALSDGPVESM